MRRLRIGIDVGSRAVKVAWTTASGTGKPLWHRDQRPRSLSESADQFSLTLRELLHPLKRHRYEGAVIVAVSQSHVRQLTLQVPDVKRVPEAIKDHLPRLFPFEVARSRYQSRLISQQPANGKLSCTLQVAACDLEMLRRDVEAFWRVGWIPSHAYPTAHALVALAKAQGKLSADPVLLLELGARRSMLVIAANGHIVLAREVALGSDYLTEALMSQVMVGQETLTLTWEQAESLKCRVGIPESRDTAVQLLEGRLPLATYHAMLQPVLEQWIGEIHRTIAFSVQEHPEAVPRKILLCGGGSQLEGLDPWLTQQVGMPVERLTVQPILGEEVPAFAVVCGLLLTEEPSSLNLLLEKTLQARRLIRWERTAIKGLILVSLGIWLGVGWVTLQRVLIQRRAVSVEARWRELQPVTDLSSAVMTHTNLIRTLADTQGVSVAWFRRLAQGFPNPVRLTELSVEAGREVRMVGQAQGREQTPEAYVSELAMWLERMRVCQAARLGSSQRSPQDPNLVDFSLTCQRL